MPDYSKGKIYSIRSHQTDLVYIGSTCQPLSHRMGGHRKSYKHWLTHPKRYTSSYELLDNYDDCFIELIENCESKSKEELLRREGDLIRITQNCVNQKTAGRTKKEYQDEHKEDKKEYDKQYGKVNKDKIAQYQTQYKKEHRDELNIQKKQYKELNKDKIKLQNIVYREKNKDQIQLKIKTRQSISVTCECGATLKQIGLPKHKRTQKHIAFTLSCAKN
jgi:hypothetical protein